MFKYLILSLQISVNFTTPQEASLFRDHLPSNDAWATETNVDFLPQNEHNVTQWSHYWVVSGSKRT